MRKAGDSTPANPEHFTDDTTNVVVDGTPGLGRQVLYRSAARHSGRAVGAFILGLHLAPDLMLCDWCSCGIEAGDVVADVELNGQLLVVCTDCAGPG